jgi:hypothetical protein
MELAPCGDCGFAPPFELLFAYPGRIGTDRQAAGMLQRDQAVLVASLEDRSLFNVRCHGSSY